MAFVHYHLVLLGLHALPNEMRTAGQTEQAICDAIRNPDNHNMIGFTGG